MYRKNGTTGRAEAGRWSQLPGRKYHGGDPYSGIDLDALKSNGTCTCSRCQADVKALMLTRLPPKYIVADNTSVPMLLTYYNNKFRVAIISQSIRACMDVKERPRHIL